MTKKKPKIFIYLIQAVIIIAAFVLLYYLNNTTLFADINTKKDNYLTLDDYLLREETDINSYKHHSNQLFDYDCNLDYYFEDGQTSKGLKVGDDINKFVSLYGPYIAEYIDVYDSSVFEEEKDDNYYDTHYFDNLSINDFINKHYTIEECIENKYMISLRYYAYVRVSDIAYGYKGLNRLYNKQDKNIMPEGSIFNPKIQSYCLGFEFAVVDGKMILLSINSYRYN